MKILTNFDFNQNQLINATIHKAVSAPTEPVSGQIYYNTSDNRLYFYNGTVWVANNLADQEVTNAKLATMVTKTIKGRKEATTGPPQDLTAAEVRTILNVADGANKYIHSTHTAKDLGLYKIETDNEGHVIAATSVVKADITGLGISGQDTTYTTFNATSDGLAPKRPDVTPTQNKYLRDDGTWQIPPDNDTIYTHPSHIAKTNGLYKVTVDGLGHVTLATAVVKTDITNLGIPASDTKYSVFNATNSGLAPMRPDSTATETKYLRDDGTWTIPPNTIYTHPNHTAKANGFYKVTIDALGHVSTVTAVSKTDLTNLGVPPSDTTYGVFDGVDNGLAPKRPDLLATQTKYLRDDGTWQIPPDSDTIYTHPSHTAKTNGFYKVTIDALGHVSGTTAVSKTDLTSLGVPSSDTTYSIFDGVNNGLAPKRSDATATQTKYLRDDGTWVTPPNTNTTYTADGTAIILSDNKFSHATSDGYKHIPTGGSAGQFLASGGTWATPANTNTTYTAKTSSAIILTGTEFSHATTAGYAHIPANGTIGQILKSNNVGVAIWGGLTPSEVGLGNVTNDAQIKKSASSISGNIPTWSKTTGDELGAGYGVETTLAGSSTKIPRADAVKTYVDNVLSANDAMIYKGTLGVGGTESTLPAIFSTGWSYKVITTGTYTGHVCEIGDLIIAVQSRTTGNTITADWTVVQSNVDGAVIGPASATSGNFPLFNDNTGKIIKNSSYSPASFAAATHSHNYTTKIVKTLTGAVSQVITHNLGTQDVVAIIRETATPYAAVMADIEFTTTNTLTVKMAQGSTAGQYSITIVG